MRFLVRKRRSAPAVIIVALIDVLIVLVIFLLVTTTFKQQSSLHLTLPASAQALKAGANENPPVLVSLDKDGVFRLRLPSANDETPIVFDQLQTQVMEYHTAHPEAQIAIRADIKAPWGQVFKVMELAKKLNVKLSAFTKEASQP